MKTLTMALLAGLLAVGVLAEEKKTAEVMLYTTEEKQRWVECEVKRSEPRFIVFISRKGMRRVLYDGKVYYSDAGKEITHSGDYTITPD